MDKPQHSPQKYTTPSKIHFLKVDIYLKYHLTDIDLT